MWLRSVFKMRTSILNTATTEQMGYGIISFFRLHEIYNYYFVFTVFIADHFDVAVWYPAFVYTARMRTLYLVFFFSFLSWADVILALETLIVFVAFLLPNPFVVYWI